MRPSYEELAAELPTQEHLNIDETATKEENGKAWLWTFVARLFTVFAVRATREATALGVFLTEKFQGIVTCDRAKMYWQVGRLQWCWAHLKRDFQAMIDSGDQRAKWLGERLRAATCELFEHWADYRHGRISRAALVRRMGPVRRKVERLLLRGMQSGNSDVRGTCRELYEHRQWLWTFLHHEGVEPTNNAGERSLRHAVIWRKLSFGTQSAPRQPLRRDDADGDRNLPSTASQRLCLHHRRCRSPSRPSISPFIAPQGVNDYLEDQYLNNKTQCAIRVTAERKPALRYRTSSKE